MDASIREKYTSVIGLEVHAQLLTKTKIYNSDSTEYGSLPNTNVGIITLGHPGTLPKLNKKVVELAIRMGVAVKGSITRYNIFDRKNYFYPDLPKGYQITQDRTPLVKGGEVKIKVNDQEKVIRLHRIHIEEDAGKSMHLAAETDTLVDFNRAGVALIEIVSEPDIRTSEEAYAYLTEIRKLVRYLDICDGNMEEGSLRCDANISVMRTDAKEFGKKVEVKNMNSIRNVQRAIDHEIERQIALVEAGETISSETRTFDATDGKTYSMRTKEELNDYRYFPDPDLSPLVVSEAWLAEISGSMPPLPQELHAKFVTTYGLPEYDAQVLTDTKEIALYYDTLCGITGNFKAASNWMMGPVKSYLNELTLTIDEFPLAPGKIAELIALVDSGKVNFGVAAQRIFPELIKHPNASPAEIAQQLNLIQDSSAETLEPIIEAVIHEFPLKVEEYKNGKKGIVGMFMGEVMKRSKGKADPKMANEILVRKLNEL